MLGMRDVPLKAGEKIEPLDDGYGIIQSAELYRFGTDAVALAKFAAARITRENRVLDLCSGCGVVGILIAVATGARVDGAELDGALCDMSVRSCALNGLDGVRFYNADVRDLTLADVGGIGYDAVVCNPPFYKRGTVPRKIAPAASCELTVEFGDIVRAAKRMLTQRGEFYFVHTATRLDETLCVCGENGLTPKTLVMNANAKTFLLRCVRGGKLGMDVSVKEF